MFNATGDEELGFEGLGSMESDLTRSPPVGRVPSNGTHRNRPVQRVDGKPGRPVLFGVWKRNMSNQQRWVEPEA